MRSPRRALIEQIRNAGDRTKRYSDMAARIRVWRRGEDDRAHAAELLPRVYGGRFDTWSRSYAGVPSQVVELKVHPGQLELLLFEERGVSRLLQIGAAGGGKTTTIALKAILLGIEQPARTGGVVAPTEKRRRIIWRKFLELIPPGWIEAIRPGDAEIRLRNGTLLQFVAAKKSSAQIGTPLQGYDWHFAVEDEHQNMEDDACEEVELRGRGAGLDFCVFSSATNQLIPQFQARLERYRADKALVRVITASGYDNVFVSTGYWDRFKTRLSKEHFDRLILGLDSPRDGAIYPRFDTGANVRPVPQVGKDLTASLVAAKWQRPIDPQLRLPIACRFVVGQDWGMRVQASVVLQAFADPREETERIWYVVGELITEDGSTPDRHADALKHYMLQRFGATAREYVVVGDPHVQKRPNVGADKTDYDVFKKAGLEVHKAAVGIVIHVRHRFGMVNALLEDASGRRRLFLAADEHGHPIARAVAQSFRMYRWGAGGEPEQHDKGPLDPSHATDALGYALFPFERIRGQDRVVPLRPNQNQGLPT